MSFKPFAAALAFAALALPAFDASASNYPPDYPVCHDVDTATSGPFEVIRNTTRPYGRYATLTVSYRGYLRNWFADDQIHIWIRLNGSSEFVQASHGSYDDAYVFFNAGPRSCILCQSYMVDAIPECATSLGTWLCQWPTSVEQDLFYWAFDQNGFQNAWDIEVAAEASGYWDSDYGQNYHVRLEPSRCY